MENIAQTIAKETSLGYFAKLFKKFPQAKAYLVGGMVRDIILGRPSKDYDFVISGVKPATLEKFLKSLGRVDLVGKTFGVFKFQPKDSVLGEPIDIALPRTEHSLYLAGGYREFAVKTDYQMPIEEDLLRRDFTINALAWDLKRKKLIDPTGGLSDLAAGIIRAVGQAEKRFQEDYSRILRGLRLAIQLRFTFESKTWQATKAMIGFLNNSKLPREIVARELLKSFEADAVRAFDVFELSGVFRTLIPELLHLKDCQQGPEYHSEGDVWTHTRLALERLFSPMFHKHFPGEKPDLELILATLFHDLGKPYTRKLRLNHHLSFYGHEQVGGELAFDIAERLRLSSYQGKVDSSHLAWLIHYHLIITHTSPIKFNRATFEKYFLEPTLGQKLLQLIFADQAASLSMEGEPSLKNFYDAVELTKEIKRIGYEKKKQPKILLNGRDIMTRLKLKPGPRIGEIIHQLRATQLRGKIRTKKQALGFLDRQYGNKIHSRKKRRTA
ncbi:MAG: HD domain-containing protein [Patescibacteria group bacterium]|nr:HD domain-containing protein [Patescibacteria group bacterium]